MQSLIDKSKKKLLLNKKNLNYNLTKSEHSLNRVYNLQIKKISNYKLKIIVHKTFPKKKLPLIIDLRSKFPLPYDQGNLGSCTANAICSLLSYNDKNFIGSRLFLYYNERLLENHVLDDSGATLEDGIESLSTFGICNELDWTYDISKFAIKPPEQCYINALENKTSDVNNLNNDMNSMKTSLINGIPFVVGIQVYSSFESIYVAKTGFVPLPKKYDTYLGGHAVTVVGYNDNKQCWIVRNSWGINWGSKGYFHLPYSYLTNDNLASDLWCIISN